MSLLLWPYGPFWPAEWGEASVHQALGIWDISGTTWNTYILIYIYIYTYLYIYIYKHIYIVTWTMRVVMLSSTHWKLRVVVGFHGFLA